MSLIKIITIPDKRLRMKAEPIEEITDEIRVLAERMAETMYAAPGVGLAAPQVGLSLRLVTIDVAEEEQDAQLMVLVNPEILEKEGEAVGEEGCLSVPGYFEEVKRAAWVKVRYQDLDGKEYVEEIEGFLAVAFQHEIDHLNGVVFIDHLSSLKRKIAIRKVAQWNKENEYPGEEL